MELVNIYKITNKVNNMIYVGQTTVTLKERFKMHLKDSKANSKSITISSDIKKYGERNFNIELITKALIQNKFIVENYYINYFYEKGYAVYNLLGLKAPKSRIQRLAESRINNKFDYQSESFKVKMSSVTSGQNNGMYGRKGKNALNGQPVWALDKDDNIIHSFISVREALNFLNIKGHTNLIKACKNGSLYKGYFWKKEWANR
ncbi:GIY-YIG nuclease family protein [Staphylococcus gallinarum]|uniref:GIY-YIG nuclease family protein n=1 Tax=Staphylococcus gallinarum TaxID=1293 RepID=UPI0030C5D673